MTRSGPLHSYNFCEDLQLVYPLALGETRLTATVPKFVSNDGNGFAISASMDDSYSNLKRNRGVVFLCLSEAAMKVSKVVIEYKRSSAESESSVNCESKIVEIDNLAERFRKLEPRDQLPKPRSCKKFETLPPVVVKDLETDNSDCRNVYMSYPQKIEGTDLEVMPPDLIYRVDNGYAIAIPVDAIYPRESDKGNEVSMAICLSKKALAESKIAIMYLDWTPPEDARGCEKLLEIDRLDELLGSGK